MKGTARDRALAYMAESLSLEEAQSERENGSWCRESFDRLTRIQVRAGNGPRRRPEDKTRIRGGWDGAEVSTARGSKWVTREDDLERLRM